MNLTRVAIDLCDPCFHSERSRMCETPGCAFWHEVRPATFGARFRPTGLAWRPLDSPEVLEEREAMARLLEKDGQ